MVLNETRMLSLAVHQHRGAEGREWLIFTSISLPSPSLRRKWESPPSRTGLERDPQATSEGQKWLLLPCSGVERLQTGRKPKQEFKQPTSHCPVQIFYLSRCYIPSAVVRRHRDHLTLHPHQALKKTPGPSCLPRRTISTEITSK